MNFEYLVRTYTKLVFKICLDMLSSPQDAEDAVQEVYINLYKSMDRYQSLPENELKNILCKIALNKCRDMLKSKANKIKENYVLENILNYEEYSDQQDIDYELFKQEKNMLIHKMINELKQPYQMVLYEYFINELSLDELECKLKIPKATLKVEIYRGKKILQQSLKKIGGEVLK